VKSKVENHEDEAEAAEKLQLAFQKSSPPDQQWTKECRFRSIKHLRVWVEFGFVITHGEGEEREHNPTIIIIWMALTRHVRKMDMRVRKMRLDDGLLRGGEDHSEYTTCIRSRTPAEMRDEREG